MSEETKDIVYMGNVFNWTVYKGNDKTHISPDNIGKWMYSYKDLEYADELCTKAIQEKAVNLAKHTRGEATGVCCFYIDGTDTEAHKRVIKFFMQNELIRKTKTGKFYDISFKFENKNGSNSKAKIKLSDFVDLHTGEYK